jgi:type IV pilus assembly protein PilO
MDLKQLNDLELHNIGDWPAGAKAIAILLLFVSAAGAWYHFDTRGQIAQLRSQEVEEQDLRASFETKQEKAANLGAYRRQLEEMKESLGAMLRQLPDKTEVAALLVDVSQTGLASGLEFELFRPAGEEIKGFYAELPIEIAVTGQFHDFGRFISGLAALPRIVTIHDIKIRPGSGGSAVGGGTNQLGLMATVKTYRYLEEEAVE